MLRPTNSRAKHSYLPINRSLRGESFTDAAWQTSLLLPFSHPAHLQCSVLPPPYAAHLQPRTSSASRDAAMLRPTNSRAKHTYLPINRSLRGNVLRTQHGRRPYVLPSPHPAHLRYDVLPSPYTVHLQPYTSSAVGTPPCCVRRILVRSTPIKYKLGPSGTTTSKRLTQALEEACQ